MKIRQRYAPSREAFERILVVTEGQKTEVNYIAHLISSFKISPGLVKVVGGGESPERLVQRAIDIHKEESQDAFDSIFCMFDRDSHAHFNSAIKRIRDLQINEKLPIDFIVCSPCFELWILLHFSYSSQPIVASGNKSSCAVLINKLRKSRGMSDYEKASTSTFKIILPKLKVASQNAKLLRRDLEECTDGEPAVVCNPWTNMDVLVDRILKLKRE